MSRGFFMHLRSWRDATGRFVAVAGDGVAVRGEFHARRVCARLSGLHYARMKAVIFRGVNQVSVEEVESRAPATGEVLVAIRAAALNHRDVWILSGQYAGVKYPCVPGSDGAGVVSAVDGTGGHHQSQF
jgi:hypothetical protein